MALADLVEHGLVVPDEGGFAVLHGGEVHAPRVLGSVGCSHRGDKQVRCSLSSRAVQAVAVVNWWWW